MMASRSKGTRMTSYEATGYEPYELEARERKQVTNPWTLARPCTCRVEPVEALRRSTLDFCLGGQRSLRALRSKENREARGERRERDNRLRALGLWTARSPGGTTCRYPTTEGLVPRMDSSDAHTLGIGAVRHLSGRACRGSQPRSFLLKRRRRRHPLRAPPPVPSFITVL